MKTNHAKVNDAVLAFLRVELERRYDCANIKRFKQFKDIDPETVAEFREFALRRVYPEGQARTEIDMAFCALQELLRSPRKIASLGKVALSAVWSLGRRLPMAVTAGQQVIQAFSCASAVETRLSQGVIAKGIPWKSGLKTDDMKSVFAELPAELFEELVAALAHLLELAGNRDTMQTGLGLLEKIAAIMDASDQWTASDRQGVSMAMDTLTEALSLFSHIDDRDVPRFVKGIEMVETDWYQTLRGDK